MSPTRWCILSLLAALAIWSCGEGGSGLTNPPPPPFGDLRTVAPNTAFAGSPDLQVTLHGAHFVDGNIEGSKAIWTANDSSTRLATTFVSSTELTATVPAALLSQPDTATVFVQAGDPEDGIRMTSNNQLAFSIQMPPQGATVLTEISPNSAPAGSPDLSVTLIGANFGDGHRRSSVVWSAGGRETTLAATFVNSTQMTAIVPAALLGDPGTTQVFVSTIDIMGDSGAPFPSNPLTFTVEAQGRSAAARSSFTAAPVRFRPE